MVALFKPDNGCKPAGGFLRAVGKKFIRAAAGTDPAGFDILCRNPGLHQLIPADRPEIKMMV
jgi:hypothetical protein